jgi:hypothetical protein
MTQPRPLATHLPAELLTLVGQIAVQSTYVDFLVGQILGALKGVDGEERAKTIHVLDTRRKTQEIEKLLKGDAQRASILNAVTNAGTLLADRNLVLHAIIAYAKPDDWSTPLYLAFRGKYVGKEVPFSKATLSPIFSQLDEISRDLMAACSELGAHVLQSSPGTQQ